MNSDRKRIVLFLCTGNSARSQMAEAFLRHFAGDTFEAHSAGLEPIEVNPLTHRVMSEIGIDTSMQQAKGVADYLGKVAVHDAIVVCEKSQQNCPKFHPFALNTHYWPFEDPAAFEGSEEMRLQKFRRTRDEIKLKIRTWLDEQQR